MLEELREGLSENMSENVIEFNIGRMRGMLCGCVAGACTGIWVCMGMGRVYRHITLLYLDDISIGTLHPPRFVVFHVRKSFDHEP